MGRAFAKFERANDGVGNDSESDASDLRRVAKVFRTPLDDNLFVLRLLRESKGAGADGAAGKVGASVRGNDANGARNEIHAEGSKRLTEMKDDRGIVGRFDGGDHAKSSAFRGFVGGLHDEFERRLHVGGGDRAAIVEANAAAEMEDISEQVGSRPRFGKIAVEVHLIVALQQAAEEEPIDALGLRIGGEARVEIGRAGFDEKGKRRTIGLVAAGTPGKRNRGKREKKKEHGKRINAEITETQRPRRREEKRNPGRI